jgi:hypothetical protein
MRRCRLLAAALLVFPGMAQGWGPEGHRAVAALAHERLCPAAIRETRAILGDQSLAEAALWPDRIRSDPAWSQTADWHYLNIAEHESFDTIVQGEPGRGRLLAAIRDNLALARDGSRPRETRAQALAFFLHLAADLHQPLHVGLREDRGGNSVTVRFDGKETNLHRLWDGQLLRSAGLRPEDYRRTLAPLVELGAAAWEAGTLEDWADESRRLRPWVYDFDARRRVPQISRRYAETGRQLTALRLAQAGVRTAWLLNEAWCD